MAGVWKRRGFWTAEKRERLARARGGASLRSIARAWSRAQPPFPFPFEWLPHKLVPSFSNSYNFPQNQTSGKFINYLCFFIWYHAYRSKFSLIFLFRAFQSSIFWYLSVFSCEKWKHREVFLVSRELSLVILCYKVIVVFYRVVIDQNQFFNFVLGQLLIEQCQVTAKIVTFWSWFSWTLLFPDIAAAFLKVEESLLLSLFIIVLYVVVLENI